MFYSQQGRQVYYLLFDSVQFSLQRLLVQLRGIDPVAAEVCYHQSCYLNYTRFLRTKPISTAVDTKYTELFNIQSSVRGLLSQGLSIIKKFSVSPNYATFSKITF